MGFVGRLGGAFLYGVISDRSGRTAALRLSIALMAGSTTLIGLLPAYATLGSFAAVLLVTLRVLQGLSLGGEFTTSLTLLVERIGSHKRGLASGLVGAAAIGGFVIGSGVAWLLTRVLSSSQLDAWGWRVPFLFGSGLAVFVWILRGRLGHMNPGGGSEPPASATSIIRTVFLREFGGILRTVGGNSLYMVGFYVPFVYLTTGLQERGILDTKSSLGLTTIALIWLIWLTILSPLAGWLADQIGLVKCLCISAVLLGLLTPIALHSMEHGWGIRMAMAPLVIFYAPITAVAALPCALQFPSEVRGTAFSIGFNLASLLFGGLTPLLAVLLVAKTDSLATAGLLSSASAAISIWSWVNCRNRQCRKGQGITKRCVSL